MKKNSWIKSKKRRSIWMFWRINYDYLILMRINHYYYNIYLFLYLINYIFQKINLFFSLKLVNKFNISALCKIFYYLIFIINKMEDATNTNLDENLIEKNDT